MADSCIRSCIRHVPPSRDDEIAAGRSDEGLRRLAARALKKARLCSSHVASFAASLRIHTNPRPRSSRHPARFNLCLLFSCLLSLSQGCGLWMPSRAHGRAKISVVRQQQGNGDRGTSAPKPTCTVHDPPCPGSYRVFIPINPKKDGFRFCGGNNLVHGCKEETWVFGGNAG